MSRRDGFVPLAAAAVFVGFALPTIVKLLPFQHAQMRLSSRQAQQEAENCSTEFAKDLYGLGVRLGVYFQWFTGWVANIYIVEEMAGALAANAIYLFALLISMLNSTKSDDMAQMDALVLLQLCIGTVWTVLSLWGYRTSVYRKQGLDGIKNFGGFGTHLRLLLGAAVGWYALWFWISGVQGLPRGLGPFGKKIPQGCTQTDVTIFKTPITAPSTRNTALAISSAWLVYSLLVTLASPLAAITRLMKIILLAREKRFATSTKLRYATGTDEKTLRTMSWVFAIFNFFLIIFMMLMVELTLNENNAGDVLGAHPASHNGMIATPSQLIPMLIGAFGFVRVLFVAWEIYRAPDGDINPSLGRSASMRSAKAKRDSTHGVNIFRIFSPALQDRPAGAEGEHEDESAGLGYIDPYFELHKRLTTWQKVMVTWLPWLSLLYFWPWRKDDGQPVPQDEAEMQLAPKNDSTMPASPPRLPTVQFEDQLDTDSIDTAYRRLSNTSAQEVQKPTETV